MSKHEEVNVVDADIFQICSFYLGDALCGIDINNVQEISKDMEMSPVPLSPDWVLGIKNLRGGIVTVIDLGDKIGLKPSKIDEQSRIIIVSWKEEYIGLLVDKISNILHADRNLLEDPPSNVKGMQGKYFQGVINTDSGLIALMNIDAVLTTEE
ncbi:MAG: purine-binding chemotaxis protein CheW [Candidatus Marinimicrobia bacterium]|nr:purine-binding chemotaxis protein CheW [Candidatus Neomarinimicrobiota bacterium]